MIKNLCKYAHLNAKKHGFWEDMDLIQAPYSLKEGKQLTNNAISTRLMLIVGEVAEAMEALRKGNTENFKEELADVCIRVFDLAGGLDIDLENEIAKKMEKNKLRPYKHGKEF